MEPFTVHTGIAAALPRADIDTDQIVPKQFLKRVERSGYGAFLFHDWRFDDQGDPREEFVLNREGTREASILITGANFGCGSSREHAAWAMLDYGIRAVLAPSFADIFRDNALQNGIATVELPDDVVERLLYRADERRPFEVTVDLRSCAVTDALGERVGFQMDDFRRSCLLEGRDRIALTLEHEQKISAYEAKRAARSSAYPS